jgi:signal transduction histidine kinase
VAQRMDEIVWAVNPNQDTLSAFVDYLSHATPELLRPARLTCRLDFPEGLEDRPLSSETRHNLFLLVREALHNVLKHASAKEVTVRLRQAGRSLSIAVEDDGRGFDAIGPARQGDGLTNMSARAQQLGGSCAIDCQAQRGTRVRFEIPLP